MPELFPYQAEDVRWLVEHPRAILGNEMRTGKTPTLIRAAEQFGDGPFVVLCPAIARTNWRREIGTWTTRPEGVADWHVESYDRYAQNGERQTAMNALRAEVVILDEAHYLANPEARRTQAVYGLRRGAQRRVSPLIPYGSACWPASGTIAPNHVGELWTHLQYALGATTRSYTEFLHRYAVVTQGEWGPVVRANRPEHLAELKAGLARVMIARTQASVWKDVPPLLWSVQTLDIESAETRRDFLRRERQESGSSMTREDILAGSTLPSASLHRMTGLFKVETAVWHLFELLQTRPDYKILVGFKHTDVGVALAERLTGFGVLFGDGSSSEKERDRLVDRFQYDPTVRVAVLQIDAFHAARNWSRADHVVFAEFGWTPGREIQFANRGQHHTRRTALPIDVLALADSLDEAILRRRVQKIRMTGELTPGASVP